MIQDIFPHRFNNSYLPDREFTDNDYVFHYEGNTILLIANGNDLSIPRRRDFVEKPGEQDNIFLFTLDDIACFLIWESPMKDESRFVYRDISFFRTERKTQLAWVSIAGYHLMSWYMQNRFCGRCGSATQHKHDERAIVCRQCNSIVYPKISPAVIVAITCNDKILLARNTKFPGRWYSLLAGYAEVGESIEETLRREVKEEVGLEISNIRYYNSQPWPLSGSLMIGFIAEADDSQPIIPDNNEIAEAAWFTRDNLPEYALNISIAGEMIEKYKKEIKPEQVDYVKKFYEGHKGLNLRDEPK